MTDEDVEAGEVDKLVSQLVMEVSQVSSPFVNISRWCISEVRAVY